MKKLVILSIVIFVVSCLSAFAQKSPITINKNSTTVHGPEKGSLIIIGGGGFTPAIWSKFTELAGGKEKANVLVVTTAAGDSAELSTETVNLIKKETGIQNVHVLHTGDLLVANSEKFIKPINEATAIFFDGGRQWHIADSYLNTLTHQAFRDLLNRGGVIAGTLHRCGSGRPCCRNITVGRVRPRACIETPAVARRSRCGDWQLPTTAVDVTEVDRRCGGCSNDRISLTNAI